MLNMNPASAMCARTGFTGIGEPNEPPADPEVRLDTVNFSAEDNARSVLDHLARGRFVRNPEAD